MADSILRLKVESQEYDNKLKQAAQGLTRYADECRKVGGTLEVVEKETLDYVRAIGQMDTTSRTATGKLAEMKKTFVELSAQYKQMTDAEKASPFGKALAASLDQLKGRIGESKSQLDDINKEISGSDGLSGALDSIAGKFGVNIEQLTKFGSIVGVATGALKTAKDAFMQNETNVDEWGRTVSAAEGIYDSFLQTLNNGDFSGFLSRIGEVITKSKEAYNALDELQTRMTIINPERTRLQARATELKAIIRRQGKDSEAGQSAQNELRQLEGLLTQAFKTESQMNMNVFKTRVDQKLKEAGISLGKRDYDMLMRSFSSDATYMAMKRGARGSIESRYEAGGSYDEGTAYRVDTRNLNQKLLDIFTDEWRKSNSQFLNAAFSARGAAASTMLGDARYLKEGGAGGGGGRGGSGGGNQVTYAADSIAAQQALVTQLTKQWSEAGADVRNDYLTQLIAAEEVLKRMKNEAQMFRENAAGKLLGGNVQTTGLGSIYGSEMQEMKIGLTDDALKGLADAIAKDQKRNEKKEISLEKEIGSISSGVSNIFGGIEQMGIVVPEEIKSGLTVLNGIMSLLSGISTILIAIEAINSADAIIPFARGGIVRAANGFVPGTNYSGDLIPALLNSGELVLNRAQQNSLANQLQGNGIQNLNLKGVVSGEQIMIVLDRHLQRSGRGELAVWK